MQYHFPHRRRFERKKAHTCRAHNLFSFWQRLIYSMQNFIDVNLHHSHEIHSQVVSSDIWSGSWPFNSLSPMKKDIFREILFVNRIYLVPTCRYLPLIFIFAAFFSDSLIFFNLIGIFKKACSFSSHELFYYFGVNY